VTGNRAAGCKVVARPHRIVRNKNNWNAAEWPRFASTDLTPLPTTSHARRRPLAIVTFCYLTLIDNAVIYWYLLGK